MSGSGPPLIGDYIFPNGQTICVPKIEHFRDILLKHWSDSDARTLKG